MEEVDVADTSAGDVEPFLDVSLDKHVQRLKIGFVQVVDRKMVSRGRKSIPLIHTAGLYPPLHSELSILLSFSSIFYSISLK